MSSVAISAMTDKLAYRAALGTYIARILLERRPDMTAGEKALLGQLASDIETEELVGYERRFQWDYTLREG